MKVHIGDVEGFNDAEPSKEYALKPLEESAEVFGAWQAFEKLRGTISLLDAQKRRNELLDECADVIQAVGNLLCALGVSDFSEFMKSCERRNRERGRIH